MERGRELGLDADHAHVGPPCLQRSRETGDESAAADRHDHDVRNGAVLEDLERDRALPGDHRRLVERMDERPSGLGDQLVEAVERRRRALGLLVDRRSVAARRRDLQLVGALPHDDQRVDSLLARGPGDGLGVVAGGDRDHAVPLLLVGQLREPVERAAHLERARALEELRLEADVRSRAARRAWRSAGAACGARGRRSSAQRARRRRW